MNVSANKFVWTMLVPVKGRLTFIMILMHLNISHSMKIEIILYIYWICWINHQFISKTNKFLSYLNNNVARMQWWYGACRVYVMKL